MHKPKHSIEKIDIGSFCSEGVSLEGKLLVDGTIHFEGNLNGQIEVTDTLIVAKKGVVRAEVNARNLVNQGKIIGNITASHEINLQDESQVIGDIFTERIVIDDGAHFEGNCKMIPAPKIKREKTKSLISPAPAGDTSKPKSNRLKISSVIALFILLSSAVFLVIIFGKNNIVNFLFNSSNTHIKAGFSHYDKGNIDKAMVEFNKAIELDDGNYKGHLWLGNSYSVKGEYEKAITEYSKLVKLKPDDSRGYSKLGLTFLLVNSDDKALEAFNHSLDFNPSDFVAHNGLGELFYKRQFYDKAFLELTKSLKIKPDQTSPIHRNLALVLHKMGKKEESFTEFQAALKQDNNDKVAMRMLSEIYLEKKDYNQAIPLLTTLIKLDGKNPLTFQLLGKSYLANQHFDKAFPILKKLVQLSPDSREGNLGLGELYVRRKEFDKAEKVLLKSAKLLPDNFMVYSNLGKTYLALDKNDEALKYYLKAVKIDPKNSDILKSIGDLYVQNKSPDNAINHFNKALKINPKDYSTYFGLCNAYTKKGYFSKAIGLCKNALDIKPDDPFVLNRLAWLYAKKSVSLNEGIQISLLSMELMPNTPEFIDTLSELYFKKGNRKKAIETINKAIKLAPQSLYYKKQLKRFGGA